MQWHNCKWQTTTERFNLEDCTVVETEVGIALDNKARWLRHRALCTVSDTISTMDPNAALRRDGEDVSDALSDVRVSEQTLEH